MPHRTVARLCIIASLAAASSALAADRIAVVATGLEAQGQLEEVLCVSQTCVDAEKVTSGGKVDGKKLDREHVKYTVVASREKKGLEVQVRDEEGKVRYEQDVEAGAGGKIAVGDLVSLAAKVIENIENPSQPKEAKKVDTKAAKKKAQLAKAQKNAKKKFAMASKKKAHRG